MCRFRLSTIANATTRGALIMFCQMSDLLFASQCNVTTSSQVVWTDITEMEQSNDIWKAGGGYEVHLQNRYGLFFSIFF